MAEKVDSYQVITDRIIAALEAGTAPWRMSWVGGGNLANLATGRGYQGFANRLLLGCAGFGSPYWVSYKQARDLGGQVRRGEKGTPVAFWKIFEKEENGLKTGEKIPFLRHYHVFNVEQCDGLTAPSADAPTFEHNPIDAAESIAQTMPNRPIISHKGFQPCYSPAADEVKMPGVKYFKTIEGYYATLFHELAHSTGHKSRLDRPLGGRFGDGKYSREELVAEMTAAYLCGQAGIIDDTLDNSASYIKSWLAALRNDNRLLITAAGQAQKAADYILGRHAATSFDIAA